MRRFATAKIFTEALTKNANEEAANVVKKRFSRKKKKCVAPSRSPETMIMQN